MIKSNETAKRIREQAEYAKNLDAVAMRKALITISALAQEIIDKAEGY